MSQPHRVLIASDDQAHAEKLRDDLAAFARDLKSVVAVRDTLARVISLQPDLVVMDATVPVSYTLAVCKQIKENRKRCGLWCCWSCPLMTLRIWKRRLLGGIDDFIVRLVCYVPFVKRVETLLRLRDAISHS